MGLVITRHKEQSLMIGDDIEVKITDVRGDKVRLLISAPKAVAVHRREVWELIQAEEREAQCK